MFTVEAIIGKGLLGVFPVTRDFSGQQHNMIRTPTTSGFIGSGRDRGHNRLLRSLSPSDFAAIAPHLRASEFVRGQVLEQADVPVAEVSFVVRGLIAMVASGPAGWLAQTGLVGLEGMTGMSVVLGGGRSTQECRAQTEVAARTISASRLSEILAVRSGLRASLLRYAQTLLVQISHTALANGRATVEERLARLLLMTHDRLEVDAMPLTHERLSAMLGVRRPGVTDAIHRLEGEGLIRGRRSLIEVRDRERLEDAAGGYYGVPERHYERLFSPGSHGPAHAGMDEGPHAGVRRPFDKSARRRYERHLGNQPLSGGL